jgi:hypothetical protein
MDGEEDAEIFTNFVEVTTGSYLFTACVYRSRARFCTTETLTAN